MKALQNGFILKGQSQMRRRIDDKWEFLEQWDDAFLTGSVSGVPVRLPHNVQQLPLHYADHEAYQTICGYRRKLYVSARENDRRHFLVFDGAAHNAVVYCNGVEVGDHHNGYTGFRIEITDALRPYEYNDIVVKLDTTENGSVPPFGGAIDYLTYGGIYRHVWHEIRPREYLQDIYITTPTLKTVDIALSYTKDNPEKEAKISIIDDNERTVACFLSEAASGHIVMTVAEAKSWSPEDPHVYTCRVESEDDVLETTFGFKQLVLDDTRMYLNGKPYFIRGLNRHQCYPYLGYAASDALEAEDARILKEELGVNAVRTSHYPQSHAFLDACDRLGLLVFMEIPGWQHLGDEDWKDQAVINTYEMVTQYRNHVSIFLWGVRINESLDDDEFYRRTNLLAHQLDPSRPTSGVRYLEKSHLLEDVYAFNDFSHKGDNAGVRSRKDVMPDVERPLLITEANGHMFPTKAFDPWSRRQEHALRHARVLNDAMLDEYHMGCFQWCMFDYQTHKDFGSGDRICYHGVLDAFRNPKLAAALYASQSDAKPVLEVGSSMDIGDYPGGVIGEIYAFTNADEVRLYKNGNYVQSFRGSAYTALPHGPVLIDDTIGCLLEQHEDMHGAQEKLVREALLAAGRYGLAGLPVKYKADLAWCMTRYRMPYSKGVELYGKYVASWGGDSVAWRFDAIKDGEVVASVTKAPSAKLHLEAKPNTLKMKDSDTYDISAVRIAVKDEFGNSAPYAQLPVTLRVNGPAVLIGPETIVLEGGMGGAYLATAGRSGTAELSLSSPGLETVKLIFEIEKEGEEQ